ncbi:MAG: VacB/RNase II family 3'-5' exoribonuclease [Deltaproteobacteria bacterium]|nr:VacB/RNase II family 3'-5' exoribonuclease [Deltaproteobacteria bacterium]
MKIKGKLSWNPKGFAFVESAGGEDVFVPQESLLGAIDGDIVDVWAYRDRKGLRGEVLTIHLRTSPLVSGRFRTMKKSGMLETFDPFPYAVVIPYGSHGQAKNGDVVLAAIDLPGRLKKTSSVTGRIERLLDIPGDIADDLRFVAHKHGISWRFSSEVERQAESVSRIDLAREIPRRKDLRDRVLFTIDGITAKDFDDAVGMERLEDGTFVLTVAIADVAHVVKKGTLLDAEAFARSFSVYFPEAAIPMLPEVLSNGIMSLKPNEDRLAVAVDIHLGPRGRLIGYECFEAVIRSHARLTYEEVNPFISGEGNLQNADNEIADRLLMLHRMAVNLYSNRRKRGCLDFDIPEVGITIGHDGDVDRVYRIKRGPAERLIEECMLLANHVVCSFLEKHMMPVLYRIHGAPKADDLFALATTLKEIGLDKDLYSRLYSAVHTGRHIPAIMQDITQLYKGSPLEGFVNQHILRSLMRARYSHEDLGHFGLATTGYLHFTSPIRRYPDMIIHRLVKMVLLSRKPSLKKERNKLLKYLKFAGNETSTKEQKTNDAMFEVIRLKTASFMMKHVGEVFDGVVTSILDFGIFVEIFDPPVDGLIVAHDQKKAAKDRKKKTKTLQALPGTVSLGDIVRVRLARVDPIKGHLDFTLERSCDNSEPLNKKGSGR